MRLDLFSLPSTLTHLLAIALGACAAGACLWLGGSGEENASSDKPRASRNARYAPSQNARDTLSRMIAKKVKDDNTPYVYNRAEENKENQEDLARLLTLSEQYRQITDLNPSITEALIAEDEDAVQAIFLEWYRRDPAAAFDALALRESWIDFLDYPLDNHFTNQHLMDQIQHPSRTDEFVNSIQYMLGYKLASYDDLHTLIENCESLNKSHREDLFSAFLDEWTPENDQEAARIISQDMSDEMRNLYLGSLDQDPFSAFTFSCSKNLAVALLAENMNISEDAHTALILASQQDSFPDYSTPPRTDKQTAVIKAGLEPKNSVYDLTQILDQQLLHDRDYPELFARGEISIDQIATVMQEQIEGCHHYPDELNQAIFLKLARHSPEKALDWARTHLQPEALRTVTAKTLTPNYFREIQDPRLSKQFELIAVFDPAFQPSTFSENLAESYLKKLDRWADFAPEAAEKSRQQLPSTHPIWEYQPTEKSAP